MKNSNLFHVALKSVVLSTLTATACSSLGSPSPAPSSAGIVPSATEYTIADRGANFNLWRRQTFEVLANGQVITNTHQYAELASGLNYPDPAIPGQWLSAQEVIQPYVQGAIAQQGQTKIIFANNLNTAGVVDVETPEGKRLVSNVLGLMYVDPASDQAVQIAQVQDSEGQVVAANQVLYTNAFSGVKASIRYKYRRDGMEQDVILTAQPPAPEVFGLNSEAAELVVVTEFINPPDSAVFAVATDSGSVDQTIRWGATSLGRGKAFSLAGRDLPVPVCKQYRNINGRYFLFEKVRYKDIRQKLSSLPLQASNARRFPTMAWNQLRLPKLDVKKQAGRPMHLAMGQAPDKGYVLDYITLNAAYTNYIFQGDTSYYLSGNLNLTGTNNIFEGGTVIKYAANASITIVPGGSFKFLSCPYHPVVFTSKDDNTVGQGITGSTGSPSGYYANPALNLSSLGNLALSELRIAYANRGLSVAGTSPSIYDAQFVNCATAVSDLNGNLIAENVLFSNVKTNFNATSSANIVSVQNATVNNAFDLIDGSFANTTLYLTNCAFVNVTNLSGNLMAGYNGFYRTPMVGSSSVTNTFYPLQRSGAASCYLTNGSVFLSSGTTAIDPYGLALIQHKTTVAPLIYSNISFSIATTFNPYVPRDTSATPALGYHYDPLDYVFSGVNVYSNMTFSAGTAVGWFELPNSGGTGYGITIYDKVILSLNGNATQPCTIARYSTVQEGYDGLWQNLGYMGAIVTASSSGGYSMNPANAGMTKANFTRHALLAEGPNQYRENNALSLVVAQNSEFWGGNIGAYWDDLFATNCLFDRVAMGVGGGNAAQYWMRNCTIHGGSLALSEFGQTWPVWIEDCAFDGTTLSVDNNSGGNTNKTYCDFNAFVISSNSVSAPGTHNVYVTNFYWQSSWFGNFYLPTNSLLIGAGSTPAGQFGLYHFTTQTNQLKETNSTVDIGYHYVATDVYGYPLDSNGDGISDYLEDANGNGVFDTGDLGEWQISPYGLNASSQLQVFTPLK